jgi:Domain of unknown function (DUF4252)
MKNILICLAIFLITAPTAFAQRGVNAMYRKHKRAGTENVHFRLPRPLFWVGSLFPKHRDERRLVRSVKNLRLLAAEGAHNVKPEDVASMLKKVEQSGYESLVMVRDGTTRVAVHAKERRGKIRGLLIVVHEPESFVIVSMRTRLNPKHLDALFARLAKDEKIKEKHPLPLPVLVPVQVRSTPPEPPAVEAKNL